MNKSVYIYTYGCQMNVHDSEKMLGTLSEEGYAVAESPAAADLVIFNTCAIRQKAEQKFYSQLGRIKHLKKKNPDMRIAVAGCVAQDSKAKVLKRAPYVDFVLGPQNIHMVGNMLSGSDKILVADNPDISHQEYEVSRNSRTRAWVSIMYGCNNFCSYCIVPFTRGREVSRPSSSILAELRHLKDSGCREVTLLGQNVNSYSSDMDFVGLLQEVDRTGIKRVRFVTSHPRDLSPDLIDAMADLPSICEHIHLPLQSGSDEILRKMNRRYSFADYRSKVEMIRSKVPGVTLTTDMIIGFPGESDDDYMATVRAVEEIQFDGIFSFKYSKRKGTRAFDMPDQIPDSIQTERLNSLLQLQDDITLKINKKYENTIQEIMIEGPSETDASMLMGRTRTNKIVTVPDCNEDEGVFLNAAIIKARHHSLLGSLA